MTNERAAQVLIAAYSFIVNQCDNQFIDNYEIACVKAIGLLMNTPDIIGRQKNEFFPEIFWAFKNSNEASLVGLLLLF